jgi:hypothetical protein
MGLYTVDFKTLAGDTGFEDGPSIDPIVNGEPAKEATLGRPDENIRVRSDEIRQLLTEQKQLNDLDRSMIFLGGGDLTFSGSAVVDTGTITAAASMFLLGMATPGGGGSPTFLDSTKSTVSAGTPSNNEIVLTSVRALYETASLTESRVNLISFEIIDGGTSAPLTVTVEGSPAVHIKVQIEAGVHTVQNVIDAINADGSALVLVLASLGAGSTSGNNAPTFSLTEWGSDLTARYLRGGAAGIAHEITSGGLSTFFGTAANQLQKGDTIAIEYDKVLNSTTTGGRLQSTPDNANINVDGALFNTRRNPEKVPNSIPVAKCIDDDTVLFANGKYLIKGLTSTLTTDAFSGGNAPVDSSSFLRLDIAPVTNIPPTTVQETLQNSDDLFDTILTEIEAARNSVLYGAFANLDLRLEEPETEISTARNSAAYATAYASLDLRLETPEAEIIAARTTDTLDTPSFGGYATVEARLDRHADHSRVFVSVSDDGAIDAMFADLREAVNYLNGTLDGGTIHCIDQVAHNVTTSAGTQFPTLTKPIRIIGQDKITITNDRTASSPIFLFNTGSEGSLLENVDIVDGGTPSDRALTINASNVSLRDCAINGETAIGDANTPNGSFIERCTLSVTTAAGLRTIEYKAGTGHRLISSTLTGGGTGSRTLCAATAGVAVLIDDCDVSGSSISNAVELVGSQATMRNSRISVGTLLVLGSGGTNQVVFSGEDVLVEHVNINLTGSGQVLNVIMHATARATVKNVTINGNARIMNYAGTPTQNPVRITDEARVDYLTVKNFVIPNTTDQAFTLSEDEPIVNIEGTLKTELPTILEHLRMVDINAGATAAGAQDWAFVGPRGAGSNVANTIDQNLRVRYAEIVVNSANISLSVSSANTRLIFTSFGSFSEIIENTVLGSGNWKGPVIRCDGATTGIKINKNTIRLTAVDDTVITCSSGPFQIQINDNIIDYAGVVVAPIAISLSAPTGFQVNDNLITRTGFAASTGSDVIALATPTKGTCMGNVVDHDGTATDPIDYTSTVTNVVPADTFQGTLNVI